MQEVGKGRMPSLSTEGGRGPLGSGSTYSAPEVIARVRNLEDAGQEIERLCSRIAKLMTVIRSKKQRIRRLRNGRSQKVDGRGIQQIPTACSEDMVSQDLISQLGSEIPPKMTTLTSPVSEEAKLVSDVISGVMTPMTQMTSREEMKVDQEELFEDEEDPLEEVFERLMGLKMDAIFESRVDMLKVRGDRRHEIDRIRRKAIEVCKDGDRIAKEVRDVKGWKTLKRMVDEAASDIFTEKEFDEWYREKFKESLHNDLKDRGGK